MTTTADEIALPRTDWMTARADYSNASRRYGKGSPEAEAARLEFWCVRLCALATETLNEYPLTDEQRERIALTVRAVNR